MAQLARWFPGWCSRLKIFMCYAHEDKQLASEIAQSLTNDGHDVFLDANKLQVSGDYNEVIRRAIEDSDRFIFLISKASISQGKYPLTELGFAQAKWASPEGSVWPVLTDPSIDVGQLPVYLRSVHIHTVKGNAPAELAAAIEQTRTVRSLCTGCVLTTAALAVAAAVFVGTGGLDKMRAPTYALLAPQQIDFRPAKKPGPDDTWRDSRLAVTLVPVQYTNTGGKQVRIVDETVTLDIKGRPVPFKWFNEVELKATCGADWLCIKGSIGADTLKPDATLRRETMFMPAPTETVSYKDLLDQVCASTADSMTVTLTTRAESTSVSGTGSAARTTTCRLNLKEMRAELEKRNCKTVMERPPARLSPLCLSP
jgi:TIR domain